MNFKNFLSNDKQLQESHFLGDPKPVILGYGLFSPFHIGYLPMIAEMMHLGEKHQAETILTIVREPDTNEELLNTVLETLARDYSFLKVVVERDVAQAIVKLHEFSRVPVAILGDTKIVEKAVAACKVVYGEDTSIARPRGYLGNIQQVCEKAIAEDDFDTFRAHVLYLDGQVVTNTYKQLRETI